MSSKTWLSINYFLQFAVNGVFLPFWILYLTSAKNITVLEASSIFSMLYFARFLSGIFISPYLVKKYSLSLTLKISVAVGLVLVISYGFTNEKSILTIITFLFGMIYFTVSALVESLASLFLKEENIDYGKVRTYGSVSFTLVGILIGGIIGYVGNNVLYYILVFLVLIYLIFMFLPQPKLVSSLKVEKEGVKREKQYSWVIKDKNALFLIISIFLYQLAHTAYNNYNAIYLESMNISTKWLSGIILNISVIAEILFFIFSKNIISKIKPTHLFILSGVGGVIRWAMLGTFHNIYVFISMQCFHAITFAMSHIAFILLLNKGFSTKKIIDMQNLYMAIGFQLSMAVGLYLMGGLWDISTTYVFYVSAGIALVGTIFAMKIKEK
ncbi:transporter, major facilitator family protein [Gemella bergeri ATCC 700627]|uniref:Transporter, major facilitator family protein n=1 Tax=Gemella bergeri ATCC 700627 TaxID=1321820 RepID=U2S234_9BACL|nr:MFS transporter [Gemella bergeri]ERK59813.1 transporter, major facilitator family protein [Gemella bergeri ATCC 700627]